VIAAVALALASPYYVRNIAEFGTPFELSRGYPLIQQVERDQPPGERSVSDYLRLSPRMFSDPNPLAPHLLRSIWSTAYLNVWADIYRESDVERALESERATRPAMTRMAIAGIVPTAFAGLGALLAVADVRRGRRRAVYVPMLLLAAATVGAFLVFTWRVPIWSAVKASYLLGLSLPFGVFVARAVEWLAVRGPARLRALPAAAVVVVAAMAAVGSLVGIAVPRRADAPAAGAVHFYFGEYDRASAIYGRLLAGARYKAGWMDDLAAVRLAEGDPETARRLYARAVETGLADPYRRGRLAVAMAVAGDLGAARDELDLALSEASRPELLANRGAVRARLGDFAGAELDLRAALAESDEIVPAWRNLALVLQREGPTEASEAAWAGALRVACSGPRGYPYGLGTGEVIEWGVGRRWLLLLADDGVELATPSFYREMCRTLTVEHASSQAREAA
jgi:tetratricopeptide (TPR) repeat protein